MKLAKYHGAGNDFLIIDNRTRGIVLTADEISALCHRQFGFGADGLMLLNNAPEPYDFAMEYFNADGTGGMLCGNGARCIVAFAKDLGIESFNFLASDGPHSATIIADMGRNKIIRVKMNDVDNIEAVDSRSYFLNTGTRHLVRFFSEPAAIDATAVELRHHARFAPEGTNVNYAWWDGNRLWVNTFEKGVEGETLACGTGITAAAIAACKHFNLQVERIEVRAKGGDFTVELDRNNNTFTGIYLTGPTGFVGKMSTEF